MSSQRHARSIARVAGSGVYVVEAGNVKKTRIDLGGEVYKGTVTVFKLDCNICGEWLR